MNAPSTAAKPAWQQFWFLFVFGLPFIAVVASLTSVYLALHHRDHSVIAHAYDEGQAINQDLALEANARALGIAATLHLNPLTHQLTIILSAPQPISTALLNLSIIHPEDPDQDLHPQLAPLKLNSFQTDFPSEIHGVRYLELNTQSWKLIKKVYFPITDLKIHSS